MFRDASIVPRAMVRRALGSFVAMATIGGATLDSHAASMRCGNALAEIGDTKAEIRVKCGVPMAEDARCEPIAPVTSADERALPGRAHASASACEPVDEWTYNPGRGQFFTTLRFVRGRLESMTHGDRVP